MSTCHRLGVSTSGSNPEGRQLVRRYFRQIHKRTAAEHGRLCGTFAICFRPGDRTSSYLGKTLRPLGHSVLIALSFGWSPDGQRRRMPLRGFRAQVSADGAVSYGGDGHCEFLYDAARRPFANGRGPILNPFTNPSLSELLYRMDLACQRRWRLRAKPAAIPQFPKIWLGFDACDLPTFEDTPPLRALAAQRLNIAVEQLGSNGVVLLDRFLKELWDSQIVPPGADGNDTGLYLVDADLCTNARKSLRVFEDFRGLVGAATWNPAREARVGVPLAK